MIKRKLFIFALLLYGVALQSQTVFWEEDFDPPPADWTLGENWIFEEELLMFRWYPPSTNYDISAISPILTLPEEASTLSIYQYLGVNEVLVTDEQAEISILSNGDESVVWNHACADGNWGVEGGQELAIPISDYAGQDIQVKFRSYGSTTDIWNYWFVYNMDMKAVFSSDLDIVAISGPNNLAINMNDTWTVEVKNVGSTNYEGFNVNLYCNKTGENLSSTSYSSTLGAGETTELELSWTAEQAYNTTIVGVIDSENDQYSGNNVSKPHFLRVKPNIDFQVLVLDLDNDIATIENPETHEVEQANIGIERALATAGIAYDYDDRVPNNIEDYEMVILTLGSFCLG